MAVANRSAAIEKLYKVLRKHYKAPPPPPERDLLGHALYSLILEHSTPDKADAAFARLSESAFDWNEVRVTTATELAELMQGAQDPRQAAVNVKKFLHAVFEAQYSFELEILKKQNLGKIQTDLTKFAGMTPFSVSYVTQHALGGHAIPLRNTAYDVLYIAGVIDEKERAATLATGLDRVISKKQGIEFAGLLHQLAVDLAAGPFSSRVRAILSETHPDAKNRLPKRVTKKPPAPEPVPAANAKSAKGAAAKGQKFKPAAKMPTPAAKSPPSSAKAPASVKSTPAKKPKVEPKKGVAKNVRPSKPGKSPISKKPTGTAAGKSGKVMRRPK